MTFLEMDAQYAVTEAVKGMKDQAQEQHMQGLMTDISEACFPICTRNMTKPVDDKCIENCTRIYIDSWNMMSRTVIPELKKQSGLA